MNPMTRARVERGQNSTLPTREGVDSLGLSEIDLLGYSLGGFVAQESQTLRRARAHDQRQAVSFAGEYDSTTSYMPGSNLAMASACCRKGAGAGLLRIAS